MRPLLLAVLLSSGPLWAGAASAAERTVTLAVENMSCMSCPYLVERALMGVPGVEIVTVSNEAKTAVVTFDDAKTDTSRLIEAAAGAGFPARPAGKD